MVGASALSVTLIVIFFVVVEIDWPTVDVAETTI
jgi:hypothetical protein